MTQVGKDSLGTRSTLKVGGRDYAYYSLAKAAEKIGDVSRLPFSMKVLLENLLRFEDAGFTIEDTIAWMYRLMKLKKRKKAISRPMMTTASTP